MLIQQSGYCRTSTLSTHVCLPAVTLKSAKQRRSPPCRRETGSVRLLRESDRLENTELIGLPGLGGNKTTTLATCGVEARACINTRAAIGSCGGGSRHFKDPKRARELPIRLAKMRTLTILSDEASFGLLPAGVLHALKAPISLCSASVENCTNFGFVTGG